MLTDLGLKPTAVLRRAGLRPDLLSGGPVWLSQDEFFGLWRALEAELSYPNLALALMDALSPEVFAPPIFAAMMSADLNQAATRIAEYKRLVGPLRLDVEITEAETSISFRWPVGAKPPASMVLCEAAFWVGLVRFGTRRRVEPRRVASTVLPGDAEAYRQAFGVAVTSADVTTVTFAAADATRPFVTANEAIWDAFEPQLRRRLSDLDVSASAEERVGAALLELLPVGRATVADVASELAVSPRTLHRQLKAEGVSFQAVLNATRERLARHYLSDPGLSAAEIAFLIGYSEASSFYRAFQSWTGQTPEQTRAAMSAN